MTTFEDLSARDRAELDAAVRTAYIRDDGTARTAAEAAEEFDAFVSAATQAGHEYIHHLLDAWRSKGIQQFVKTRWSAMSRVNMPDPATGKTISRPLNRGRKVVGDDGSVIWERPTLLLFTVEDIRSAIEECRSRIRSEQITIANYQALLDLLERHPECRFVHEALASEGVGLDEYLASAVGGAS